MPNGSIILFIAIGIVMWLVVMFLASLASGWYKLAKLFPDDGSHEGTCYRMRYGEVGCVKYSFCLSILIADEGLGLSIFFPFRIGHPPMFIPWSEFHGAYENNRFLLRTVEVNVGRPVVGDLKLPRLVWDYLPSESKDQDV